MSFTFSFKYTVLLLYWLIGLCKISPEKSTRHKAFVNCDICIILLVSNKTAAHKMLFL